MPADVPEFEENGFTAGRCRTLRVTVPRTARDNRVLLSITAKGTHT